MNWCLIVFISGYLAVECRFYLNPRGGVNLILKFFNHEWTPIARIEANRFDFFLILVLLLVIEDALQIS